MSDKVAVYAATRNIYDQMYVCLKSLLLNNPMDRVYLLIEDDSYPFPIPDNVFTVNVSEQEFFSKNSPNFNSPWSYMTMMRCVLSEVLAKEDKVLWLDCDTIVIDDITDLFDLNMDGYFYAGALEPGKSKDVFRYINAGVLLCNLALLRKTVQEQMMVAFLNAYKFGWCDQDIINLLNQLRIRIIGSEYNQNAFTLPCSRPRIIHYAAVKDFKNDWAYKKFEQIDLPLEEKPNE